MYVAAPIMAGAQIIGVVRWPSPTAPLQPYIERSEQRLARFGGGLIVLDC
jgi:two-component system sensor histidine kinase CreC